MQTGLENLVEKLAAFANMPIPVQLGIGGAAVGAGLGGLQGLIAPGTDADGNRRSRLSGALHSGMSASLAGGVGGVIGGGLGAMAGGAWPRDMRGPANVGANVHDVAPWLKGVKTKAEAKSRFRDLARTTHPDLGGSTSRMQTVNDQWAQAQAHPAYDKFAALYAAGQAEALRLFFTL